ncbi:MAG: hypothetical protein J0L61_09570 [Planctomycetes bacterium]|nr:hypothetical protein [Planctomycetota bacterium]
MVTKLLCASAVLAVAGAANAATFRINVVDAGGVAGGTGSPITWTGTTNGAAYNNAAVGGNNPPSQSLAGADSLPATAFDSYIAIDSRGPTIGESSDGANDGYTSSGPGNYIGLSSADSNAFRASGANGSLIGVWFNTFDTSSTADLLGAGVDSLFLGQISLRPGSTAPTTQGLVVNIKDNKPGQNPDGVLGALRFGEANATDNGGAWGQSYYLAVRTRTIAGASAAFNGGTTYEIYVATVAIPAPGAVGVAGLAGLAAFRRRR